MIHQVQQELAIILFSFIVPDDFCNNLTADSEYININYVGEGKEQKKEEVAKILEGYMTIEPGVIGDDIKLLAMSREIAYDSNVGMSTIILFVAIYIGIVFFTFQCSGFIYSTVGSM